MRYMILIFALINWTNIPAQNVLTQAEIKWLNDNVVTYSSSIDQVASEELVNISIPNGTKIIGLGEANHGTKEFQILKHKLAKYLIDKHEFNTIVFEFPYSHGLLLNDYVQGKNEAGLKVLTDQKNSEYHNKQMLAFIEDIKRMNESKSDSNKIQFLGIDIMGKPYALKRITGYFGRVGNSFETVLHNYQYLTEELYEYPSKENHKTFKKLSSTIYKQLKSNRQYYISKSSSLEYNRVYRLAELLGVEWKGNSRAKEGAKNILNTLNENPKNKLFYFAHNWHVSENDQVEGNQLKKEIGSSYFSIGTDYQSGSFTLKNMTDRKNVFPDVVNVIPMVNCFADHITSLKGNFHYLKIPDTGNGLNSWMSNPLYFAGTGMGFNRPFTVAEQFRQKLKITHEFDAIIVFDKINPTTLLGN